MLRAERAGQALIIALIATLVVLPTASLAAQDNQGASVPAGVPSAAEAATVRSYVDGDKFKVRLGGKTEEVLMIGVDAPELTNRRGEEECFAKESSDYLRRLIKKKQTVYLERDQTDRDGKQRLLRYVWVPEDDGAKASLLNTKLIRDGYATFNQMKPNTRYDRRFGKAEDSAREKKRGLWGVCDGNHVPLAPGFDSYETGYINKASKQIDTMSKSMNRFTELMQFPRYGTDEWTVRVAAELVTWQFLYEEAAAMTPPAAFAPFHDAWTQALSLYASAADDIIIALDNLDPNAANAAVAKMNEARDFLQEANRLLNELREERQRADSAGTELVPTSAARQIAPSGGLGNTRDDIYAVYGEPSRTEVLGRYGFADYPGQSIVFLLEPDGAQRREDRAFDIMVYAQTEEPWTVKEASAIAARLLPTDAVPITDRYVYEIVDGVILDLRQKYVSPALASRVPTMVKSTAEKTPR